MDRALAPLSNEALVVVAVGGNALLRRGDPVAASIERANALEAARHLAVIGLGHRLVVTHGNGPQVGLLALESAASGHPETFDVLDAESQGQVGYLLEIELANHLGDRSVCTLLTQVRVDADDPAFSRPTKPIGPAYDEVTARGLAGSGGWRIGRDGSGWRRLIASPEPLEVMQLRSIELLSRAGVVVICAGGGGIPVVVADDGRRRGVEAVIDKDLTSALLAVALDADRLVLLTDVAAVEADWGTPEARAMTEASVEELRSMTFAPGTMAPKVEAACRFASATGRPAVIGALEEAERVINGAAGTRVRP